MQAAQESVLETIAGPGPAKRRDLLRHFGGLQGVVRAGTDDLAAAKGIGRHWRRPSTITCTRLRVTHPDTIPNLPTVLMDRADPGDRGPVLSALYWADVACGLMFALPRITDSLDGYLARRLGLISRLGAFLDPVADKLIVAVALVLLVSRDPHWLGDPGRGMIIGREIAVSALREWMAESRHTAPRGRVRLRETARPSCR